MQVNAEYSPDVGGFVVGGAGGCGLSLASIVVEPDCLISGTVVASSIECPRRYILTSSPPSHNVM